jgi:hypothetical protein
MKLIFAYFLFTFQFISHLCLAQIGCTDPQAQNFDPAANWNDGSCTYASTNYNLQLVTDFPDELQENSGLIFYNNLLYSINDGGNSTDFQEIDIQGNILRSINVSGAQNIDWEAISQNDSTVFLGDFGNNGGNRHDLGIYRVSKNEFANNDTVTMNQFWFTYPDQISFTNTSGNHNFDCEAFVYLNDSLHLFTKGWQNLYTKHYVLPVNTTDTIIAILRDSLWVDGLITDASIDSTTGRLLLLGYKNNGSNFYTSFVYLIYDYINTNFFSGNKRRIEIGNMLTVSQTEGITFNSSTSGFISSEKITSSFLTIPPKLFSFNFQSYLENPISSIQSMEEELVMVYPNPANHQLTLPWSFKNLVFFDHAGNKIAQLKSAEFKQTIDLLTLPLVQSNTYYIQNQDTQKRVKFLFQ